MSPTQDDQQGRFAEALACWRAQLAGGRSWGEVESEIITFCQGRVDLLTRLLIEAETLRWGVGGTTGRSSACTQRYPVAQVPQHHWSSPVRVPEPRSSIAHWY
jgi:hypothetical protein